MEIRTFAETILRSDSLAEKLQRPEGTLTDNDPGEIWRPLEPVRPSNLQFAPPRAAPSMPKPGGLKRPDRRAIAHHIMANHELQALEVMAFVLVAFPDAPAEFRSGMVDIMFDEQRHTRMHMVRAAELGLEFGDKPVNCYIWKKAQDFHCVLDYVAGLPMVFEGANLDHTCEFEDYFNRANDAKSAAMMRAIHKDEIEHVAFGFHWLRELAPEGEDAWDTWMKHLHYPLRPSKSKGERFNRAARKAAGMPEEFIDRLAEFEE